MTHTQDKWEEAIKNKIIEVTLEYFLSGTAQYDLNMAGIPNNLLHTNLMDKITPIISQLLQQRDKELVEKIKEMKINTGISTLQPDYKDRVRFNQSIDKILSLLENK